MKKFVCGLVVAGMMTMSAFGNCSVGDLKGGIIGALTGSENHGEENSLYDEHGEFKSSEALADARGAI